MVAGRDFDAALADARAGDEDAFADLYRRFQPGLLRFLRARDAAGAEDAAAEAWLEVVKGLEGFVGDESGFLAWLFTIARRKVIDRGKYNARRPTAPWPDEHSDDPLAPDVADLAEQWEATAAAIALVRTLPPDQADVIQLRGVAGLEIAEVAELLGRSNGAVRVLAHRGLRRLGAALADRVVRGQV
jgi:RNA polymerase sigma-70 factor (ECF subfamily)